MKTLQDIAQLDPKAQELLEAAGYFDISSMKGSSLNEITAEIVKANHALEILEIDPTAGVVKQWLEPLKDEIGDLDGLVEAEKESDLVSSKELLAASFAIPLTRAFVEVNDIEVDKLLAGRVRFLSDDVSDKVPDFEEEPTPEPVVEVAKEEVKLEEMESEELSDSSPEKTAEIQIEELDAILPESTLKNEEVIDVDSLFTESSGKSDSSDGTVHIDKRDARINKDRIMTMDAFRASGSRVAPLQNSASGDLTRSTRKETNKGVNPNSKRYIRGVLHKRAGSFMFSLFAYLTFILCIIAGFTLPLLTLIDKEKFFWAMFSPLLVIVGVMIYFMFTGRASCPICNQRQFAPKNCLKHRDAHKFPMLGYMLPTALHALFFKWFKCIFCGTSVRLKE